MTYNITVKSQVISFNDFNSFSQYFTIGLSSRVTFKHVFGRMFLKTKSLKYDAKKIRAATTSPGRDKSRPNSLKKGKWFNMLDPAFAGNISAPRLKFNPAEWESLADYWNLQF